LTGKGEAIMNANHIFGSMLIMTGLTTCINFWCCSFMFIQSTHLGPTCCS